MPLNLTQYSSPPTLSVGTPDPANIGIQHCFMLVAWTAMIKAIVFRDAHAVTQIFERLRVIATAGAQLLALVVCFRRIKTSSSGVCVSTTHMCNRLIDQLSTFVVSRVVFETVSKGRGVATTCVLAFLRVAKLGVFVERLSGSKT